MALERGTQLRAGDTINTGTAGGSQVWMDDDSTYTLAGNTTLRIDEFISPQPKSGQLGKSLMTLAKGAMRSVSGLISYGGGSAQVQTDVATMGIRGTIWAVVKCQGQCHNKRGGKMKDGVYVLVSNGVVVVSNAGGSVTTPAGKISFIASNQTKAEVVDEGPTEFIELESKTQFEFEIEPDLDRIEPPISPS